MINSENIHIVDNEQNSLKALITSIYKEPKKDEMQVEMLVGGICLNSKVLTFELKEKNILPGNIVNIKIDTSKVCWI